MTDKDIVKAVAELCCILENDAPKEMFSGEIVAEMFNQIISGHSATSAASKHNIAPPRRGVWNEQ